MPGSRSRRGPTLHRSSARGQGWPTSPAQYPPSSGVGLLRQAEIGERALAVPVSDEPRHLAVLDEHEVRYLRLHRSKVEAAGLAAPAEAEKDEHPAIVEVAVLVHRHAQVIPDAED